MTYRERREARADRLDEWADKRTTAATAQLTSQPELRHDWAFITQPGRIVAREKMNAGDDRAFQSLTKAQGMTGRAAGIRQQLDTSIYDDDPDAIERLTEKAERLEAKRDAMKLRNAEYRKTHRAELKSMSAWEKSQAMPHASYELSNLGATIRTTRERIARLERDKIAGPRYRTIVARFAGRCDRCSSSIEKGDTIGYCRTADERVICAGCNTPDTKEG